MTDNGNKPQCKNGHVINGPEDRYKSGHCRKCHAARARVARANKKRASSPPAPATVSYVKSPAGVVFDVVTDTEQDGTLTVLTPHQPGYAAAHLAVAVQRLGTRTRKQLERRYVTDTGAVRVLSCWMPE